MRRLDLFDAIAGMPADPPADPPISPGVGDEPHAKANEAHDKLARNLDLALSRHGEILARPITAETDPKDKRLTAEVATATVKSALAVDRTTFKARQADILEQVSLGLIFVKRLLGEPLNAHEIDRARRASRSEIEAALEPREVAEIDAAGGVEAFLAPPTSSEGP